MSEPVADPINTAWASFGMIVKETLNDKFLNGNGSGPNPEDNFPVFLDDISVFYENTKMDTSVTPRCEVSYVISSEFDETISGKGPAIQTGTIMAVIVTEEGVGNIQALKYAKRIQNYFDPGRVFHMKNIDQNGDNLFPISNGQDGYSFQDSVHGQTWNSDFAPDFRIGEIQITGFPVVGSGYADPPEWRVPVTIPYEATA